MIWTSQRCCAEKSELKVQSPGSSCRCMYAFCVRRPTCFADVSSKQSYPWCAYLTAAFLLCCRPDSRDAFKVRAIAWVRFGCCLASCGQCHFFFALTQAVKRCILAQDLQLQHQRKVLSANSAQAVPAPVGAQVRAVLPAYCGDTHFSLEAEPLFPAGATGRLRAKRTLRSQRLRGAPAHSRARVPPPPCLCFAQAASQLCSTCIRQYPACEDACMLQLRARYAAGRLMHLSCRRGMCMRRRRRRQCRRRSGACAALPKLSAVDVQTSLRCVGAGRHRGR